MISGTSSPDGAQIPLYLPPRTEDVRFIEIRVGHGAHPLRPPSGELPEGDPSQKSQVKSLDASLRHAVADRAPVPEPSPQDPRHAGDASEIEHDYLIGGLQTLPKQEPLVVALDDPVIVLHEAGDHRQLLLKGPLAPSAVEVHGVQMEYRDAVVVRQTLRQCGLPAAAVPQDRYPRVYPSHLSDDGATRKSPHHPKPCRQRKSSSAVRGRPSRYLSTFRNLTVPPPSKSSPL